MSHSVTVDVLSAAARRLQCDPPAAFGAVCDLWTRSDAFCAAFSDALAGVGFEAFFWETPAATSGALAAPFECVVTLAPSLARLRADGGDFAAHIDPLRGAPHVAAFPNLGGDAELIVPGEAAPSVDYAHLAALLRTAPEALKRALWAGVGAGVQRWAARGRPFWISTSGLGVPWVHVRLDTRPKCYVHAPYHVAT
jgi:hypothetical protein